VIIKIRIRPKQLAALLVSICLVLALVLSACGQEGSTTTTTAVGGDKVYKVLNPTGNFVPIETHPLAPRLDTLAGKNIYYYQSEANPVIMPVLLERLKEDYPTATWKYFETQGHGEEVLIESDLEGVDACIRGVGW